MVWATYKSYICDNQKYKYLRLNQKLQNEISLKRNKNLRHTYDGESFFKENLNLVAGYNLLTLMSSNTFYIVKGHLLA